MGFPFCFFTYSVSASFHSLVMVLGGAGAVMKRVKAIGKRRRKHRTQQKKKNIPKVRREVKTTTVAPMMRKMPAKTFPISVWGYSLDLKATK